jgi:spermidine/putrescine transport system substrate-binding protein
MMLALLLLAACAPAPAEDGDTGAAPAVTSERCGDPSQLSDTVSFYNWADYIDPAILDMFEEECGVEVIYDNYASNEDLLAKLQAGATGYDLIVPSDYMITIMLELDMLRELNKENLPNISNIDERFVNAPYDPGMNYSVPYQWGTTGIGFDAAVVGEDIDGWDDIFDPERAAQYDGRLTLLNDQRELMGAALKYLGYSVNSTDPTELEEAKQVILGVKPHVAAFDSESFGDLLVSGEAVIGHGWSGDYLTAIYENEDRDLRYIIPKEGAVIWTDAMAIPKTAPNPYTAEVLINYLLDPEIGAMISNYVYYASPNTAAEAYMDQEILNDPAIYPSDETLERLEFIRDVGEATLDYERIWTEIKAQ